jgi:membrane protein insertase Oxa1/YidC/SpoIIIJ
MFRLNGVLRQFVRPSTKLFRKGERFATTEMALTLPHVIQAAMTGMQSVTGAPWWVTIGLSTLFVRFSLVPLVRAQVVASRALGPALPEIRNLTHLLRQRQNSKSQGDAGRQLKYVSAFTSGVSACMKLYEVPTGRLIAYPLINMGIFITFVYSVRDMLANATSMRLLDGGTLWFTDLASSDPTFALPFAALGLSYLGLELAFGRLEKPVGVGPFLKDFSQCMIILSTPFVVTLPAGVFCYWIPSSLFAIAQSQLLKSAYGQNLLKIPPMKLPAGRVTSPSEELLSPLARSDKTSS